MEYLLAAGAHGLGLFGNASEGYSLMGDERVELLETIVKQVNGRVPLVVSSGHTGTDAAVKLSREAQDLGAGALMVLPPYFLKTDGDGLIFHYEAISKAIGIPIMVQDAPLLTQVPMPAALLARMGREIEHVTMESGLVGWGEAQAPLAPEVACTIVRLLLEPVLLGQEVDGTIAGIEQLWMKMYSTMRVRGQTGGFMLDAISGVDIALWDIVGKMAGRPVSDLIAGEKARGHITAYISGLAGANKLDAARPFADQGFTLFKLFPDSGWRSILHSVDQLRRADLGVAVDALWRLEPETAVEMAMELDPRRVLWLEAPLPPEDPVAHTILRRAIETPIAIGESYRTSFELRTFILARAMQIIQPDLGRCGITEGLRIAAMGGEHGMKIVPHVSIAMGPQVAAAVHFAAAVPNCSLLEYNPGVLEMANRFLREPLVIRDAGYAVPQTPGLGIEIDEDRLAAVVSRGA